MIKLTYVGVQISVDSIDKVAHIHLKSDITKEIIFSRQAENGFKQDIIQECNNVHVKTKKFNFYIKQNFKYFRLTSNCQSSIMNKLIMKCDI